MVIKRLQSGPVRTHAPGPPANMHVPYVVVVVVAAVVHWAGAQSASELAYANNLDECISELGMTKDEFRKSGDPTLKVQYCLMTKDGTVGPDGKFSAEGALAQIESFWKSQPDRVANATRVVAACRAELEAETAMGEALAKKIMDCFSKNDVSGRGPPTTPAPAM
ncbi:uncharacterized protein LOC117643766 [Thrips palmi]|uniref:Uncharacterized protein LOC117643766 n=1 Tax=Thrips palmi TaxID=161013 RepID=A0A6P8YPC6_THRPL|nr:uncharacterized protein LOC117643766 [Thrips palmi]